MLAPALVQAMTSAATASGVNEFIDRGSISLPTGSIATITFRD
jgi:hypothetical protein